MLSVRYDKKKHDPHVHHYKISQSQYDIFYTLQSSKFTEIHG